MNLSRKDFKFIEEYMKKYNIPEGKSYANTFAYFLIEYKKNKLDTKLKLGIWDWITIFNAFIAYFASIIFFIVGLFEFAIFFMLMALWNQNTLNLVLIKKRIDLKVGK